MDDKWLTYAKRLHAIAAEGQAYSKNQYDLERFQEIDAIAQEMLAKLFSFPIQRIREFSPDTVATKLSVSATAREAGVTPALIHNHYPSIAKEIRVKLGASSRERRDAARDELKLEREKSSKLRKELAEAMSQIAKFASINETLLLDN